jgi:hypothetical protein
MQVHVKNSIYNGTPLEGLPFNLLWTKNRPEVIYEGTATIPTVKNYQSWVDINYYHSKEWLQKMFLHDICHCILYAYRGQVDKIFKNDFGLTWDDTIQEPGSMVFKNLNDLDDECKIVMLGELLDQMFKNNFVTKSETVATVATQIQYIKDFEDYMYPNKSRENDKRLERLRRAYDYWIDPISKESHVKTAIAALRMVLKNKAPH